jgi:hypothetical protein
MGRKREGGTSKKPDSNNFPNNSNKFLATLLSQANGK